MVPCCISHTAHPTQHCSSLSDTARLSMQDKERLLLLTDTTGKGREGEGGGGGGCGQQLWDSEKSSKTFLFSRPSTKTSFSMYPEGEMRNCFHALLRIKKEKKRHWRKADFMSSILNWCTIFRCGAVEYHKNSWSNVSLLLSQFRDSKKVFLFYFNSASPLSPFLYSIDYIVKEVANFFRG